LAKNTAVKLIDEFSEKMNYSYSNAFHKSKSDHFGLPQFGPGAMENWGLVLYRENYLFYEDGVDDEQQKMTVLTTIGHEIMHQWFGNLVGCDYWDELWISEAFATLGGFLALQFVEPSWKWEDEFWYRYTKGGLKFDSTKYSHPIVNKANNGGINIRDEKSSSKNAVKQFDRISYHKAGSILRMIKNIIGQDSWWAGVRHFLAENQYSAVDGVVLMNTMARFVPTDVLPVSMNFTETFDPWIRQEGYPILNISRAGPGEIQITVRRFQTDATPSNWPESSFNYEWNIPFSYKTKFNKDNFEWLTNSGNGKIYTIADNGEFLLANVNSNGFYRVTYDDQMFLELLETAKNAPLRLSTIEKASLFSDYGELNDIAKLIQEIVKS